MKISVTLKDPDTMQDAVDEAMKRAPKPDGISAVEWAHIRDERALAIKGAITDKFMEYGEYLRVVFTVDEECREVEARVDPLQ